MPHGVARLRGVGQIREAGYVVGGRFVGNVFVKTARVLLNRLSTHQTGAHGIGQAVASLGKIQDVSLFENLAVIDGIRGADELQVSSLTRLWHEDARADCIVLY